MDAIEITRGACAEVLVMNLKSGYPLLFQIQGGHPNRFFDWEQFTVTSHTQSGGEFHIKAAYAGGGLFTGKANGDKGTPVHIVYNPHTRKGLVKIY